MRPELLQAIGDVLRGGRLVKERVKPSALKPALRPLQILLAEDNAVNQMVAVAILSKRGHVVRIAANGQEALAAYQRDRFDLVLMDVQMPVMGGFEATAAIRALERATRTRVPIVALTAHAMKGDRETCLAAGMDGYLTKPFKGLDLIQEVERLTAGHGPVVAEDGDAGDGSLLGRFRGDVELLCAVAAVFLTSEPLMRSELAGALSQDDAIQVSRTAHTLIGSVGNFGAAKAVALAEELRLMGEGSNLLGAGKVFGSLTESLDLLRFQLAGVIQGHLEGRAGQAVA